MNKDEVIHWELRSKLLCGESLDIEDDRYLVNPQWTTRVNCVRCVNALDLLGGALKVHADGKET